MTRVGDINVTIKIDPEALDRLRKQSEGLQQAIAKVAQDITIEDLANISRCIAPMSSFHTMALRAAIRAQEEQNHEDMARRYGYAIFPPEMPDMKRVREWLDNFEDRRSRWQRVKDWLHDRVADVLYWGWSRWR